MIEVVIAVMVDVVIAVMVNMVIDVMRCNFGHDVVSVAGMASVSGVAEVGRASNWAALGGVVDQLLRVDGRALLEECVSARGVVAVTRAVRDNVEVRRMI